MGSSLFPKIFKVSRNEAKRSLLAARSVEDLVAWSGNLYKPPAKVQELVMQSAFAPDSIQENHKALRPRRMPRQTSPSER